MDKTYSFDDFASEPEQTFSLADFEGAPATQTFSLADFEETRPTAEAPEAPVAQAPSLDEPTPEELEEASKPAFVYRRPGNRVPPTLAPGAVDMPGSVMHGQVAPDTTLPTTSKAPIRPEMREAFNAQWDAATPEQRQILQQQEGIVGQLARDRAGQFARQEELTAGMPPENMLTTVDPRVEERRARLIAQGEDPRFAERAAMEAARAGVIPGGEIQFIESEYGTASKSEFDFETNRLFRDQIGANNPLVRGTAKAVLGMGKAALGLNEFLADSIGADKYADFLKQGNKWLRQKEGAIGEKGAFFERNLEGAISSIGQQLPWMIGTIATGGGTAIPLVAMGLQTFGQEYTDGRSQKQDVQQAATRASLFAAFEVLGERFGLKQQFELLRGASKGMSTDQLVAIASNMLKKEVPGELFTTTGQFAVDKWMPKGYALNPDATVEDFVKQVADTIAQTVLQGGLMGAGATSVSAARRYMGEKGYSERIAAADAEAARTAALNKWATQGLSPSIYADKVAAQLEEAPVVPTAPAAPSAETPVKNEPTVTVDPETGEVLPAEPTIGTGDASEAIIEREATRYAKTYNLPLDLATEVVRGQYARGELDIGEPAGDVRAGADDGRIEPSVSVPNEGAATTTGAESPRVGGLDGDLRPAGEPVSGEETQRTTLDVRGIMTANTDAQGLAGDAAANAIVSEVDAALKSGTPVTLYVDNKPVPIVAINNGMMQDAKGQRWGTLTLLTDPEGKLGNKIEFGTPQEAQTPTLTERAPTPVQQAEVALQNAEQAVAAATTAEEKKVATKERNKARQAVKKAKAEAPAIETPTTPAAPVTPTAPTLSQEDQSRLDTAKRDMAEAQGTLATLAEQGFTSPDQHYGVESAQRKVASAQEVINELEPTAAPTAETPTAEAPTAEAPPAKKRGRPAKPKAEGVAPTEPKKRGRKKVELTPEELARKDAERKTAQKDLVYAAREVDKKIKDLQIQVDPAKFDSLEAFELAKVAAETKRKNAIYKLHQYATAPSTRNAQASGRKAAQALASDLVTPKERADLQARVEFEKTRGPKPSAARRAPASKPIRAFYKFTTAPQAIEHIIRNGTPFERALATRLKPFVADVRLVIADNKEDTHESIQDLLSDAAGIYSSRQFGDKIHRMIVLRGENYDDPDNQGVNNIIFLHEALHAATEAKIYEAQDLADLGMPLPAPLQTLMDDLLEIRVMAQTQYDKLKAEGAPISPNVRHKFETLGIAADPNEFVAYGMSDPDIQQFLLNTPGRTRKDSALGYIKDLFSGFVNTIRRAFGMDAKHQSALQDLMLVTEGLLREQELEPAVSINTVLNAKIVRADTAVEKARLSIKSSEAPKYLQQAAQARSFSVYKKPLIAGWGGLSRSAKEQLLFVLPTTNIIDWKGDQVPAFHAIDRAVQYMSGMRQNLLKAYSRQADILGKFASKQGEKGMNALATAMHIARLSAVSPTLYADRADALRRDPRIIELTREAADPGLNENSRAAIERKISERRDNINVTYDAWEALGAIPDGQKMYKMVRQFYRDSAALTRALLDRNIDRLNLEGNVNDPATPKGRLMLAVRRMYEDSDFRGVDEYFPFMRHGTYVLEVQGPSGRERYHFDTDSKREEFINTRAAEINADPKDGNVFKVYRELGNENRDKFAAESRMLTDMFNAIEEATSANTLDKEALKDELYQVYLSTLPEQSFRKHYMHADNVTGFSKDIFRNFKTSATRIAGQAAKLRYAPDIVEAITRARDTLEGMPPADQAELGLFVDEMQRRAMNEINPQPENQWANAAAQFSFYMLLTGAGSAMVQMTALPVYVMPALNAQYGYGKAAKAFAKWTALYKSLGFRTEDVDGVESFVAPTVGESSLVKNNPIMQRAFNEALARDIIGQSLSGSILDLRRTPDNAVDRFYKQAGRTFLNATAGLFSGSERLTREIAFMMAFDLEYAKSGDFDQAVDAAADVLQRYVGRFDKFGRPPALQGWGKVLLQFKPYAALVTTFLVNNVVRLTGRHGKAEMLRAINTLGGILLMGSMFYGVTGLPLYDVICAAIDMALESLENEDGYFHKAGKAILGEEFAAQMIANKRQRIANNPLSATNSDMRFRYEFLPKWFGDITFGGDDGKRYSLATMLERGPISVLSDVNVGPRMSLNGIWFKEVGESENFKEQLGNWAKALGTPPVAGAVERVVDGVTDITNDKYLKGFSQITPALYAGPLKAELLRQEGQRTKKGDVVLAKDELSTFNVLVQMTGLGSTRAAAIQDKNFKERNQILIAEKQRAAILKELSDFVVSPDNNGSPEAKKKWNKFFEKYDKFNARYPLPGLAIPPDTLIKVSDNAQKNAGMAARGLRVKETLAPYILPRQYDYIRQVMGKPQ